MEKEIKHLNDQLDQALKDYEELQKKIDEALNWIELLRKHNKRIENIDVLFYDNIETIIKILKGEE